MHVTSNRVWHAEEADVEKSCSCLFCLWRMPLTHLWALVCFLSWCYFSDRYLEYIVICPPHHLLGLQTPSGGCWSWSWCWCWQVLRWLLPGLHSPVWAESLTSLPLQVGPHEHHSQGDTDTTLIQPRAVQCTYSEIFSKCMTLHINTLQLW